MFFPVRLPRQGGCRRTSFDGSHVSPHRNTFCEHVKATEAEKDQKREQAVAIFDLLDNNSFALVGDDGGPYQLCLSGVGTR
ncbi:UPF0262 family protein [Rhizobium brockwellii]|uniref:UPF0262 family protein n=1 Tax=Rhizobium brockwellii TaxID=3019932 RepID=UPI003F9DA99E